MLIEQIYSTDEDLRCERCNATHGTFVSFSCDHKFCVLCLSFMYVKHRKFDPNEGTVKCLICQKITNLHPSHLQIVTKTLKQQFVPIIQCENNNNQKKTKQGYNKPKNQADNRKIKSQQHSLDQNITPSVTKYFFSKCQSPSSLKKDHNVKPQCITHKGQIITHICFNCQMQPLCIKCTSSSKKHLNHQVKDIQKGISIISQQASYALIQITQKIQRLELCQKRYEDRKIIIKSRTQQLINQIKNSFQNIYMKVKQKQQQIIEICQNNLNDLIQKNNNSIEVINQTLNTLNNFLQRINQIQKNNESLQYIYKWMQIKQKLIINYNSINIEYELQNKIKFPSNSIIKQIDNLTNEINLININIKYINLSRVGIQQLQNCKSQSKLKKQSNIIINNNGNGKRLKTNFVSLNSSRQKKIKKCNKTQEDQRRLRTEKINIEKDKRNSKMPAYITDYINKKTHKFRSDGSSIAVFQITQPNIQNSKVTSKLSKTISPEQINHKKKDNMALIKERIQRKTVQPTCKVKPESNKKKKAH